MNRTERERGVTVGGFAKRLIQLANFRAKVLPAETLLFPLRFRGNTARGNTARGNTARGNTARGNQIPGAGYAERPRRYVMYLRGLSEN